MPETRLRVALFSGNYNCVRDGANQALNRLVAHLLTRGADVRVYSPVAPTPAFEPAGTLVPVRSFAIPGRPEYRLAPGLSRAARADLAAFAPDLVHLSAPDPLGRAAQRWARRRGVPVVASLHTRFETYFAYYGLGWARPLAEAHLRRFYRDADRVLAPNAPIARELRAQGLAGRVGIWSRGVDPALFSPDLRDPAWRRAHGYADDEAVLLFFGRLVKEKGLELFADAVARLRAGGRRVRPLIVGDGPWRAAFARRMPNAVFTGHLSGAALGRAVASADIFLNPSRTEAFGNVTLEAMASGVAIVSADVPSATALVEHGRSALLVPPADAAAMAAAVARLSDRPALRRALADAALADAAPYRWEAVLDEVLSVYRMLVPARAARAAGTSRPRFETVAGASR